MGGRFITFEGIEGVGKTTQISRAKAVCEGFSVSVCVTREPGGTPLAEQIRQLVLAPHAESLPPVAELLLMSSARSIHTEGKIKPALTRGEWVLCDRYVDATRAYQGGGRGLDLELIESLSAHCALEPDLTIWLDAPVELALKRVASRNGPVDRFEAERSEFFEKIRAYYQKLYEHNPGRIKRIDATNSVEEVAFSIATHLKALR